MADGDEIPAPPEVAEGLVGGEAAVPAVQPAGRFLAVDMVDAVGEVLDEGDRVKVLPDEVARVKVQAEGFPVSDGIECADGGPVVVGSPPCTARR